MLAMFRLAKRPTPGLVLLLPAPAFLILLLTGTKRSEHEPNFDLDHDGLRFKFLNQQIAPEE